jgi:hypothetical protein
VVAVAQHSLYCGAAGCLSDKAEPGVPELESCNESPDEMRIFVYIVSIGKVSARKWWHVEHPSHMPAALFEGCYEKLA